MIALLSHLLLSVSFAQSSYKRPIKGIVVDSATHAAMNYVTVVVEHGSKNKDIKTTFTDKNGNFELTTRTGEKQKITLTHIGYKTKTIQLSAFTSSAINLGKITLTSTPITLEKVEVVMEKQLVEYDINKITYNVDVDPESRTISAFEMLSKIPLLTVDIEDNIELNGNGSYQVLVNGKTSSIFVSNPTDAFKSMRASSIKSIEIITNPPSRYNAEGIGGIINIITYKKSIGGYNGSVNTGANTPEGSSISGYLSSRTGKVGLSTNFSSSASRSPISSSNFFRDDKIWYNRLEQTGESSAKNRSQYLSSQFDFELDTLNLLTANYSINVSNGTNDFRQHVGLLNSHKELKQAYKYTNIGMNKWFGNDLGLDYKHSFKKNNEQLFTISYKFSNSTNKSNTNYALEPLLSFKKQVNTTESKDGSYEQSFQVDYVQPIKKQMLELGIKSTFRVNNSDYFYKNQDSASGEFVLDTRLSNNFDYRQNISAAYASLSMQKGRIGLKAGVRIEKTKLEANFKSAGTIATQNYFNLIPNIALLYKLKRTSILGLSYNQGIERPGLYYLNPYVDITDPQNISYGNPKLSPATSQVFNLSYNSLIKGSSINLSIFHNFTNNSIQYFTFLGTDTVARTTFANIGRNQNYGLSVSCNATAYKKLNINLNSAANLIKFTSMINGTPHNKEGFTFNVFCNTNYRFDKAWRVSGNIGYNSPSVSVQGRAGGYISNSILINKQFMKNKKAGISLSVTSPFRKNRRSFIEVSDLTFYQLRESSVAIRRYNISFNYRFGKL